MLFGGTFFYNRTDHVFFQSLSEKNKKQKFVTRKRYDGRQRLWLFLLPVGRPRPFCSRARVYRAMGDAPHRRAMKIERGVVYNPTIHHGYLLEKNRHPGRRQPWPLPPPIGPPRPLRSRAHVDRAMVDAPYRQPHENLVGVAVLPNNPPLQFLQNNLSSWAPPAMVSTAGPSAAVLLKGTR